MQSRLVPAKINANHTQIASIPETVSCNLPKMSALTDLPTGTNQTHGRLSQFCYFYQFEFLLIPYSCKSTGMIFLENNRTAKERNGWIEVICGSMFSGKTEELIRRLKRARIAKQKVEIFKPEVDQRYHQTNIVSHDEQSIQSTPVKTASQILLLTGDVDVVGIDEAQFFDDSLPDICNILANKGMRVIVAGLDMDYRGVPFGPMPRLLAIAEFITKTHAICMRCGNLANYSHRISMAQELVLLGEKETYEPLCRDCFNRANKNQVGK